MQMPASDDDREMMARFNDTFRKLKTNREQVPLKSSRRNTAKPTRS